MNRKRKSADIVSQLGEPLPLPYRPSTGRVKIERTFEESVPSRSTSADLGLRNRLHSEVSHLRNSSFNDLTPHENHAEEHLPLPIWRKASTDHGRRDIDNSDYSIEQADQDSTFGTDVRNVGEHEIIIRTLQQKLATLRQESEDNSTILSRSNLKTLEKIGDELDGIVEEIQHKHILDEQQHIIQELEKYQRSSVKTQPKSILWWYVFPSMALLLMLSMSFLAGHFSYEYCYYLC